MNVKICKNTVFAYKNIVNNNPLLKKYEIILENTF